MRRGTSIGLAFGLSGFIAGAAVIGMMALSIRSAPAPQEFIIAEPAALDLGPTSAVPHATLILEPAEISVVTEEEAPSSGPAASKVPADRKPEETEEPKGTSSGVAEVPVPRRKPRIELQLASTAAGLGIMARETSSMPTLPKAHNTGSWPREAVSEARAKCERLLRGLDVKFQAKEPIGRPGGCGIAYPVSVAAVAGVEITPPATLNCEMVAALHGWITDVVQPVAKQEFNTRLTGVQNASAYVCRLRNNSSSGKLSEHGLGNAFDIADFRFSNRMEASVAGSWSGAIKGLSLASRGDFLKRARSGACKYFNTVLGPGSDAYHKDHFHLDLMKLRTGRGKYCR